MPSALPDLMLLTSIPIAAVLVGAIVGLWRTPSAKSTSVVQHFAVGVIFAAVTVELVPAIIDAPAIPITFGFAAGIAVMLVIGWLTKGLDGDGVSGVVAGTSAVALLVAMSVDVFIDGLLVGIGFSVGEKQGVLLSFALALELLFLGLAVTSSFARSGISQGRSILAIALLAFLVAVGAALGDTLLASMAEDAQTALLSFGVAALLYLVTEELLVEAHQAPETRFGTSMFFAGFLIVLLLEKAMV